MFHSADLHLLEALPGRTLLARRIVSGATNLLFVSPSHRARFLALLPPLVRSTAAGRAHVCPMGVPAWSPPDEKRRALRKRLGFDAFSILSLGRLVPIKGLVHAIDAVAGRPDMELIIAGVGPEEARLRRLSAERGAKTRFVGLLSGSAKNDHLAAADAFVLPSKPAKSGREEGVPTTLLEAMVAGLPVVATRTGGVPSIVSDDVNGLLVPPGDSATLGQVLGRLAEDRNLRRRLSRQAKKTGGLYTWAELAPNLDALVSNTLMD